MVERWSTLSLCSSCRSCRNEDETPFRLFPQGETAGHGDDPAYLFSITAASSTMHPSPTTIGPA